jgi:hypothetical protein
VKEAEAAKAISTSATHANSQIQKANHAAKISYLKQSIANKPSQFLSPSHHHHLATASASSTGPWNYNPHNILPPFFVKPLLHSDPAY